MAPSTPPPPSRALLAALTIASTASPVMSPRIAVSLSVTDWSPECSCYDPRDRSCKPMAITTSKTLTSLEQAKSSYGEGYAAGTEIYSRFYWSSAHWLARRWPQWFQFDRGDIEPAERVRAALPLLVTPA